MSAGGRLGGYWRCNSHALGGDGQDIALVKLGAVIVECLKQPRRSFSHGDINQTDKATMALPMKKDQFAKISVESYEDSAAFVGVL